MLLGVLCTLVLGSMGISSVSSTWGGGKLETPLIFRQPSFDQFKSGFGAYFTDIVAPKSESTINYQAPVPEPSFNHLTSISEPAVFQRVLITEPGVRYQAPVPEPGFNLQTLTSMTDHHYQAPNPEPILNYQPSISAPVFNHHAPVSESIFNHQAPVSVPVLNHQAPVSEPNFNHQTPVSEPIYNHQAPVSLPVLNHQAPVSEPNFNHQAPVSEAIYNHQASVSAPVLNHQAPLSEPNFNYQAPVSASVVNHQAPVSEPILNHQTPISEPSLNNWAPAPEPEPFSGNSNGKQSSFDHGNTLKGHNMNNNGQFPFERNVYTGKKAYQPMLPGFPEVSIPDGFKDRCFHRVKAAFAKAYPSLPKLTERVTVIAEPIPKFVGDLPHYAFPMYTATGIVYVPYRIPTSNFPLFVPFNASVDGKLELDRHPLLLPFTQLAASQAKYKREYPVYIGFSTKRVRAYPEHAACGSDIFLPFKVNKKEFYRYRRFSLELPEETQPVQSTSKTSTRATQFVIPRLTPIGPIAPVISNVISQAIPMPEPEPFLSIQHSQFIPSSMPILPMIQADTKDDWSSVLNSASGSSWDIGSKFPSETVSAIHSVPALSPVNYFQPSVLEHLQAQGSFSNFQAALGSSTKTEPSLSFNSISSGSLAPPSSKAGKGYY